MTGITHRYENVDFLVRGKSFEKFWKEYLADGKQIKYIMGLGFDPRTMKCFTAIRKCMEPANMHCQIIEYSGELSHDSRLKQMLERNTRLLEKAVPTSEWNRKCIRTTDPNIDTSLDASKSVRPNELDGYTDIVLDISAMPTSVYFPITRNILDWISNSRIQSPVGGPVNLHMVVSENSQLDGAIRDAKIDDNITHMYKFAKTEIEAKRELPRVWIPLLGKGKHMQLETIYKQVEPLEFCPLFPMPSADPYRCKNLLIEHRKLLVDGLGINPKDYVYSHEMNPFEVCRKIYSTAQLQYDLFKPLKGCMVVISPLSSKLMCVGALLAACELLAKNLDVGVVYVAARGYEVDDIDLDAESNRSVPHSMWLTGECYADDPK